MFKSMQIFRKRFNFKLINRFLQNKTKSFLMDNTGFDSWVQPCKKPDSYITGLQVINSLYPSKLVEFIPINGKQVTWYMCGPTVYDYPHMGHARTYLSFDLIRRIMKDYFKYDVVLCMNITDIDDKIIIRSRALNEEFNAFSRKWENQFFKDMGELGVAPPDILTRVSEFIPEIINFIQKIHDNGFAYVSNGSVYFNVKKYKEDPNHVYGKLEPFSANDVNKMREGEGALTAESDKQSPDDFALWKKSKEGEPKWPSPWGDGRPGWHIECSTMAAENFSCPIDIHSGGVDLRFPHHDNEIAQSEAYYQQKQWVNYFLHSGHLNIEGLKMSKSLKNFITIQEILKKCNPEQLRLLFLLHKYDALMNYGENSFDEAINKEKNYRSFFQNLRAVLRKSPLTDEQKWGVREKQLNENYQKKKKLIHENFCLNFNTPGVIAEIDDLIKSINTYISTFPVKHTMLASILDYLLFIFNVMGLNYEENITNEAKEGVNLVHLIDSIAVFRDQVRNAAIDKDHVKALTVCDKFRDDVVPNFGIRLEDKGKGEPSIWKLEDKETLLKEKKSKVEEETKKQDEKEKKKLEKQKAEEELLAKMKINPKEMYMSETDKYSQFDEDGIPTHDKDGKEISKSLREKKLKKDWNKQKELYEKYLKSLEDKK